MGGFCNKAWFFALCSATECLGWGWGLRGSVWGCYCHVCWVGVRRVGVEERKKGVVGGRGDSERIGEVERR
jgi:hypothetical protein